MSLTGGLPTAYKDNCSAIESVVLCPEDGLYGVDIPQGVWHKHPRDNAIAERVNGILKTEWLYDVMPGMTYDR